MPLKKGKSPDEKKQATKKHFFHFKKQHTHRMVLLSVLGICLLALVVFYFLLSNYRNTQHDSNKRQIANSKQVFKSRYRYLHQLEEDKVKTKMINEKLKKMETLLLDKNSVSNALDEITQLAEKMHLKLSSFKPKQTKIFSFYALTPIHVAVIGKFKNIEKFVKALSTLPYFVVINNFTMTLQKLDENSIHFNLALSIYSKSGITPSKKETSNAKT